MVQTDYQSPDPGIGGSLEIVRIFHARSEIVWKAWSERENLMRWWSPQGSTCQEYMIDFRVGGKYLFCVRSPEGEDAWGTGTYIEIVKPERIVFSDSFADAAGSIVPAARYGIEGEYPLALLVTVTLTQTGAEETRLRLQHDGFPSGEARDRTRPGWESFFDKLDELLPALSCQP